MPWLPRDFLSGGFRGGIVNNRGVGLGEQSQRSPELVVAPGKSRHGERYGALVSVTASTNRKAAAGERSMYQETAASSSSRLACGISRSRPRACRLRPSMSVAPGIVSAAPESSSSTRRVTSSCQSASWGSSLARVSSSRNASDSRSSGGSARSRPGSVAWSCLALCRPNLCGRGSVR